MFKDSHNVSLSDPECQEYPAKNILDTIPQKCAQNVLSSQAGFVLSCWYLEGTCTSLSKIWYFAQMQRLRVKCRYRSTLSICAGGAIENVLRLYFVRLAADCAENTTPGNPWLLLQFYIPQWFATVPHCFEASVQLVPTISFTSCLQSAWTAIDFFVNLAAAVDCVQLVPKYYSKVKLRSWQSPNISVWNNWTARKWGRWW